jgi:hypothetical protein
LKHRARPSELYTQQISVSSDLCTGDKQHFAQVNKLFNLFRRRPAMRKWGVIITLFYIAVLALVILPLWIILWADASSTSTSFWDRYPWPWAPEGWVAMLSDLDILGLILFALWWLIVIAGQAILLFVSVDTSFRRLKPRRHILVSIASVSALVALLSAAVVLSIGEAIRGDDLHPYVLWSVVPFWLVWGLVFYRYKAGMPDKLKRMTGWLLKGSILELLIVVPCHIIVRQRGECCAGTVTAFGIATGIAIMLLAFGPSVLFLYQKKLAEYSQRKTPGSP